MVAEAKKAKWRQGWAEDPFRLLVDNHADMTCIYSPDGLLVYANYAYATFFGEKPADLVGTGLLELVPEHLRNGARENLESSVAAFRESATKTVNEFGLKNIHGDLKWIEFSDQPVFDEDGELTLIISAGRDVTIHHEDRARLVEINQKLADSNRDLEDFAYVASHDLQEPLRKIIAFSARLSDKAAPELSPKNLDYLDRIGGAAGRMQNLIEDLLEVSRVSTRGGELVPVDLGSVLDDVLSDLEVAIERQGARVEISTELPKVPADEIQMRQLFQNLIGNALKFRRADTVPIVTISSELVNKRDLPATLKSMKGTSFAKISVMDNGLGFDEKHAVKIFTIFHRLHGRTEIEGSGIGLAVCKKITDRHNGDISAHGQPGDGATFEVILPIA